MVRKKLSKVYCKLIKTKRRYIHVTHRHTDTYTGTDLMISTLMVKLLLKRDKNQRS